MVWVVNTLLSKWIQIPTDREDWSVDYGYGKEAI
jgi:hypothetical protein